MKAEVRAARTGDAPGIARVHVESWRTTYSGLVPEHYLSGLSVDESSSLWRERLGAGSSITLVAEAAGETLGFASGGPSLEKGFSGYEAELYAVYLLRKHQRGGVGHRLFAAVAGELLRERGPVFLWTLAYGPACGFYERIGGVMLGSREIEIGGAKLTEVAYGWREMEAGAGE